MTTRRDFLKSSGMLVVSVAALSIDAVDAFAQNAAGPYPDPDFRQLDAWIVIHNDNTATFSPSATSRFTELRGLWQERLLLGSVGGVAIPFCSRHLRGRGGFGHAGIRRGYVADGGWSAAKLRYSLGANP